MYFYTRKVGVCSIPPRHRMCERYVLVAPSVQYECVEELASSCEELMGWYYRAMRDAITRRWMQRTSTPSTHAMLMLGISTFEDALVGGVDCLRRTTKGTGGLYAHSMNTEIVRQMNLTNHVYFYNIHMHALEDLMRTIVFSLRRVVLEGSSSHFARVFRENFVSFRDDGVAWLVCPKHKVAQYELALLMSQHGRLGSAAAMRVLPVDIIGILLLACYTVCPHKYTNDTQASGYSNPT